MSQRIVLGTIKAPNEPQCLKIGVQMNAEKHIDAMGATLWGQKAPVDTHCGVGGVFLLLWILASILGARSGNCGHFLVHAFPMCFLSPSWHAF